MKCAPLWVDLLHSDEDYLLKVSISGSLKLRESFWSRHFTCDIRSESFMIYTKQRRKWILQTERIGYMSFNTNLGQNAILISKFVSHSFRFPLTYNITLECSRSISTCVITLCWGKTHSNPSQLIPKNRRWNGICFSWEKSNVKRKRKDYDIYI